MNELSKLTPPRGGGVKEKKRVGRGQASGLDKTAGRGGKGQKARTGNMNFIGFEGGQMPIQRRVPKRGFTNHFKVEYAVVNVGLLEGLEATGTITADTLEEAGVIKRHKDGLKILATATSRGRSPCERTRCPGRRGKKSRRPAARS